MLKGRFGGDSGRPFVEARLFLPRLGVQGDVSFIVDTGADGCVLMPADALRLGVDYDLLEGSVEATGVGGPAVFFKEPAILVFVEPGIGVHVYETYFQIAQLTSEVLSVPSLLGRTILDRMEMIYDPSKATLSFVVRSDDAFFPLE